MMVTRLDRLARSTRDLSTPSRNHRQGSRVSLPRRDVGRHNDRV